MLCFNDDTQKDKNIFKEPVGTFYVLMLLLIIKVPLFCC